MVTGSPLSDVLHCARPTAVVDIGANPVEGDPPYQAMLTDGLCTVVGFEPQPDALDQLIKHKGRHETYLPYVVGDGRVHPLYVCRASGMTSTLRPDPRRLALFNGFSNFGTVIKEVEVPTRRLDDITEIEHCDLLKMDIQGGELMVLENGWRKLRKTVAIQLEVSFVPLYEEQPSFGQLDIALRRQGFVPHMFPSIKRWALAPTVFGGNFRRGKNQVLDGDMVYVRDIAYLERLDEEQLSHLALIAHHVYGSTDLARLCLEELAGRGSVPSDAGERFQQQVEA